jgi:hypothetical protein
VFDGVLLFGFEPGGGFVVEGRRGWSDEDEAVHEGVIDGALEAVAFGKGISFCLVDSLPFAVFFAKVSGPGAIGFDGFGGDFVAVNRN